MLSITEIRSLEWAALVKFVGPYATGGQFRPVPLRLVRGVVHKVLVLRTEAGAYSDAPTARNIRRSNGIDPQTFEVIDKVMFDSAVARAVALKLAASNKRQEREPNGSQDEVLPEALTPAEVDPTLRALRYKLGPVKAPLKRLDPKSLRRLPQPVPAKPLPTG